MRVKRATHYEENMFKVEWVLPSDVQQNRDSYKLGGDLPPHGFEVRTTNQELRANLEQETSRFFELKEKNRLKLS